MADSRYRITERVASGGMAEVFRGVAESLQGFRKNIAIKRVLPQLTKNKKFVAMFLDEARLSLGLQHANIVQVFDIGHTEDTYFIVMEYVDGVDLKALLEWRRRMGRRIPIAQSLYIITEMCKGISYAHDLLSPETGRPLGIVHRDISPPNVLISKQGEVKVVDFGLAKATSQIETTDPGVVKGKMSYLSPEAARGEEVDSRSDIFAIGILLYELLTGKRLFYGETDYQTVELVRNARIPPIRAQNPEVEPELEEVVRRALAKRKEDRYETALDLQDALAQYSYARGLKVIARDIAELVRTCLEERAASSGAGRRQGGNIIDTLLQDEINKFTSVGFEEPGARPLSAEDLSPAGAALEPGSDLIDPRDWAFEAPSAPGRRPTGSLQIRDSSEELGRPTVRDADMVAAALATSAIPGAGPAGGGRRATAAAVAVVAPAQAQAPVDVPTPGPDTLAAVLEPTPSPQKRAIRAQQEGTGPKPLFREPTTSKQPGIKRPMPQQRKVIIGVAIGCIVIGTVVAVAVSRRAPGDPGAHPTVPVLPAAAQPTQNR